MIPASVSSVDRPLAADSPWEWLLNKDTVDSLFKARLQQDPDADFLYDERGTTVTYAEFDAQVKKASVALAAEGIGCGTRVAWQLPTRISTIVVMFALRHLDAVQAPIIPLYREREVTGALQESKAEYFISPGVWQGHDFTAMVTNISTSVVTAPRIIEVGYESPKAQLPESSIAASSSDPEEVKWVFFTSGATGRPKGAKHSDRSLVQPGIAFAGVGELGRKPNEVGSIGFPIAHIGGILYIVSALAGGFPILLLESFSPPEAVQLYQRFNVTTTGGAPPFYQALIAMGKAESDSEKPILPKLRTLKGGGAPCPESLFDEAEQVLDAVIAHEYGMTEVPFLTIASPSDPIEIRRRTVGRPAPTIHMRIADSSGKYVPYGTEGEVQISGPGMFHGYTDAEETRKAFTEDGWFRTGDLGCLYPTGHIALVGRLKDIIIRKGENISPQEVELVLSEHPDLAEVAVIGIPDAERGERACAVIAPKDGRTAPTASELTSWLLDRGLIKQKLPEQIEVMDALPRTGLAKVAKDQLRKKFSDH